MVKNLSSFQAIEWIVFVLTIMRSEAFFIFSHGVYTIFPHIGPKEPHSRPAPKRKYGIFGLDVRK